MPPRRRAVSPQPRLPGEEDEEEEPPAGVWGGIGRVFGNIGNYIRDRSRAGFNAAAGYVRAPRNPEAQLQPQQFQPQQFQIPPQQFHAQPRPVFNGRPASGVRAVPQPPSLSQSQPVRPQVQRMVLLTKTTNLSLPGQPVVTLEILQNDFKEYQNLDEISRELQAMYPGNGRNLKLAEQLARVGNSSSVAIHKHCSRMLRVSYGLADLKCIGGDNSSRASSPRILRQFRAHLSAGWDYYQRSISERMRYNPEGLTRLLDHLITGGGEGLSTVIDGYALPYHTSYESAHYPARPELSFREFLYGINKYLDTLLQFGPRGEYMHSRYVMTYTQMAVVGYSNADMSAFILSLALPSSGFRGGCSPGNADRVVLALGDSIRLNWDECEASFPAPASDSSAPASDSGRSAVSSRSIDDRIAKYKSDGLDHVQAKLRANADVLQENRDALIANLIYQGLDLDAAQQIALVEFPSPIPRDVFDQWKEFILRMGPPEMHVDAASISHDVSLLHSAICSLRFAIFPTNPRVVPRVVPQVVPQVVPPVVMSTSSAIDDITYDEFLTVCTIIGVDRPTDEELIRMDIDHNGVLSPFEVLLSLNSLPREVLQQCIVTLSRFFDQRIGMVRMPRDSHNPVGRLETLVEITTAFSVPVPGKSIEKYNTRAAMVTAYMDDYKKLVNVPDKNLNDFLAYLLMKANERENPESRQRLLRQMTVALYQQSDTFDPDEGGNLIGYLKTIEEDLIREGRSPGEAWIYHPEFDGGRTRKSRRASKLHNAGKKSRRASRASKVQNVCKKSRNQTKKIHYE